MEKTNLICHIQPTFRRTSSEFAEFVDEHTHEIKSFQKSSAGARCVMQDGTVHEFITEESYSRWCLGRTYMLLGSTQVYRSGYPCRLDMLNMEEF